MIRIEEPKRDYELEWLEAERELAILQYEYNTWLIDSMEKNNG